jgi:outer membrane protein OmpA-like peptidoglycan-associated protein
MTSIDRRLLLGLLPLARTSAATWSLPLSLVAGLGTACITASDVSRLTAPLAVSEESLASQELRLVASAGDLERVAARAHHNAQQLSVVEDVVYQAEQRAVEAERKAIGSMERDVVYEIDDFPFAPGSAALEERSLSILDQLGERLLVENSGYYLEICGEATGDGADGRRLAAARAEAIRRHLHERHSLPLRRISTIAGGCAEMQAAALAEADRDRATVVVVRQAPGS